LGWDQVVLICFDRRPDLFGSPPGNGRSPKRRSGGQPPSLLNRVFDDTEDNGSDLTQYLSLQHQKGPRNIFDEDDDEEDQQDQTVESMVLTQTINPTPPTPPTITANPLARNSPSPPLSQTSESMIFTQTINLPARKSPSPSPPQRTAESTHSMNPLARHSPSPLPSQTFESMVLTRTINPLARTSPSPSPPVQAEFQQPSPLISKSPIRNIDIEMDLEDPEAEEEKEEEVFEFDIPLGDDDNMQITQELPSYLNSNMESPSRSALSPFRPLLPQQQQQQKDMSSMYSPHRSFFLHDQSPLSQERFNETIDTDRIASLQDTNDGNITLYFFFT
jgi:hypothetical protein